MQVTEKFTMVINNIRKRLRSRRTFFYVFLRSLEWLLIGREPRYVTFSITQQNCWWWSINYWSPPLSVGERNVTCFSHAGQSNLHIFRSKYLNIGGTTNWSVYEICNFLRRISSRSPNCDTRDIRCVANENVQKIAFFRRFFTAMRWKTVTPAIGDREVNLHIK